MAQEEAEKANARIRTEVASLGIPASEAPQISMQWYSRGLSYGNRDRRNELYKLADAKLAAMAKAAKGEIRAAALEVEKKLILGGPASPRYRVIAEAAEGVRQATFAACAAFAAPHPTATGAGEIERTKEVNERSNR